MKALTVHQPWATLIALGHKPYETRTWETYYRGPLLIHAGRQVDREYERMVREEGWLHDCEDPLPTGKIVAVANLASVITSVFAKCDIKEALFGDFSPGRWAWRLEDVRPLAEAILCRGRQGLWTPDADVIAQVEAQVRS